MYPSVLCRDRLKDEEEGEDKDNLKDDVQGEDVDEKSPLTADTKVSPFKIYTHHSRCK